MEKLNVLTTSIRKDRVEMVRFRDGKAKQEVQFYEGSTILLLSILGQLLCFCRTVCLLKAMAQGNHHLALQHHRCRVLQLCSFVTSSAKNDGGLNMQE